MVLRSLNRKPTSESKARLHEATSVVDDIYSHSWPSLSHLLLSPAYKRFSIASVPPSFQQQLPTQNPHLPRCQAESVKRSATSAGTMWSTYTRAFLITPRVLSKRRLPVLRHFLASVENSITLGNLGGIDIAEMKVLKIELRHSLLRLNRLERTTTE